MVSVDDIVKIVKKVTAQMKRKVMLMIAHGLIEATKDSGDLQLLQASFLADETKNDIRVMGHFGLASHAPKESECIMVAPGGNREAGVVIATENRKYRFKNLGEGEVALYSKNGDHVHLKNGNVIDVKTKTLNITASTEVNITSPVTNISGDLNVGGNVDVTGNETIGGNSDVTGNVTSTGDVTGINVIGVATVGGPAMAAGTSLTVAGVELKDYEDHNHDYQDTGATSNPSTTGSVN